MGDFADAERIYTQLKEKHPTNAVRACVRAHMQSH